MASSALKPKLSFSHVANNFGNAAHSYDLHAAIQRDISRRLRQQCPPTLAATSVIDLGCGTGHDSEWLLAQGAKVHAVDIAAGMLSAAAERCNSNITTHLCNVLDLANLDLEAELIWSNCMLQWADDLGLAMQQIQRCLKPGGSFVGSLFTDGSLRELRKAWRAVDDQPHLIELPKAEAAKSALLRSGLTLDWEYSFNTTAHFEDLNGIRDHLRGLGATNTHKQRNTGLMGKSAITTLRTALDAQRVEQGIPLSWQAWLFKASKPL